ncbi:MAG: SCP2 sterol-binding domain-containing protein [Candidatus Lokiarchaeota archaeon]|nr:SCP2 sterol-binding domain-containing protein [Candidatus Harpocratesius repetitus]
MEPNVSNSNVSSKISSQKINKDERSTVKEGKKKKLRGFPSIIWNQVKILNNSEKFKQEFGNQQLNVLLIAVDDRRSAIVRIKNGEIFVEQVKNKPEELKPIKRKIKARITTDITTFLKLSVGKVNPVKALLHGKLKIRRPLKVIKFTKIFKIIYYENKKNSKNKEKK